MLLRQPYVPFYSWQEVTCCGLVSAKSDMVDKKSPRELNGRQAKEKGCRRQDVESCDAFMIKELQPPRIRLKYFFDVSIRTAPLQ